MIKAILIDDERPSLDELEFILLSIGDIDVIGRYENVVKGIEAIGKNIPDIVFLDIHMPAMDGMNAADIINSINSSIKIVFATAYDQYAIDAFEKNAFDYILKPFSAERIEKTLKKLCEEKNQSQNSIEKTNSYAIGRISVLEDNKVRVISTSDILYFTSESSRTIVVAKDAKYNCSHSLSSMEQKIDGKMFFRCHKSFIVNLSKVTEVVPWFNNTYILKLGSVEIPVSRNKIKDIKKLFCI